jgi:hypothetical protein
MEKTREDKEGGERKEGRGGKGKGREGRGAEGRDGDIGFAPPQPTALDPPLLRGSIICRYR